MLISSRNNQLIGAFVERRKFNDQGERVSEKIRIKANKTNHGRYLIASFMETKASSQRDHKKGTLST